MSKPIHPIALFRLTVIGPLISRDKLRHGERRAIVKSLAEQSYKIPDSKRTHLSPQTIENWYAAWQRGGIDALIPKERKDKNKTQLSVEVQKALLITKNDNNARSINMLIHLLEQQGLVARGKLARATVHRFLQTHKLSKRTLADGKTIERRSFEAKHAGDIWYGDVLHGPSISTPNGQRKTYLVSLMDDASRLIVHSAFCFGETALDVEGVLKQAILKRGIPRKLVIDNGSAYRAHTLQSICARLKIHLIYCRPYEPEGKGKLERFHRTFREMFLNEINLLTIQGLEDFNARLWVWIEQFYHTRTHSGLDNNICPIERWRQDLMHIRHLGVQAASIDDLFLHRENRAVSKDGTVKWDGKLYEVPYQHSNKKIILVFDPHAKKALYIESPDGEFLGEVILLDKLANLSRHRQRPQNHNVKKNEVRKIDAVELQYQKYLKNITIDNDTEGKE